MKNITFKSIGIIRTPYGETKGTPIQASGSGGREGTVELDPQFADGLRDLDGFSHIILLYYFDRSRQPAKLLQKPFLEDEYHGVFAIRSPSRPNPIGISIVKLLKINGSQLKVADVDILDQTPLLDIKPYIPHFDERKNARFGWAEKHIYKTKDTTDDGRFEE